MWKGKKRRCGLDLRARIYGRIREKFVDKEFTARDVKEICSDVSWTRVWGALLDLYEIGRLYRHWHRRTCKERFVNRCYLFSLAKFTFDAPEAITGARLGELSYKRLEKMREFVGNNVDKFDAGTFAIVCDVTRQTASIDIKRGVDEGILQRISKTQVRFV